VLGNLPEELFEGLDLVENQEGDETEPGAGAVQDQVVHIEDADGKIELDNFDDQRDRQPNPKRQPGFVTVWSEHRHQKADRDKNQDVAQDVDGYDAPGIGVIYGNCPLQHQH